MKKLALFIFFLTPSYFILAQGTSCADMDPICTDVGASFTANTGTTSESGNNYGCLSTQPNPSWYYFEIATNGNIDMSLTAPSDIDFIIWGPYANLAAAQANCGSLGPSNQVDCSYSATNNETPSIPNTVVGEVYIMLITNYANIVQNISLTQTGGAGSTDCNIVNNPPCFMSFFEANISACDPATDTYSVSGQIDFDDPPATGDLIVVDCNGNQVIVASAPFSVNGSGTGSYNYTLTGSDANGLACDVTAYFSVDPTCTMNITYTAPECLCSFTYMSIQQHACDPVPGTFLVDGYVEFESAPSTGTLTFTNSCTGATDIYNAPFTSPQTYSFPGIVPAGNSNCTITAVFSADPGCTMTSLPYNDPANCTCPVDIGTFSEVTTGDPSAPYDMCFGESFTVTPNGDFIPHDDQFFFPSPSYQPGIAMGIFSCPPSVNPPADLNSDPCFLGVVSANIAGGWTETNTWGDCGTYWYAPISLYNTTTYTYAIVYGGVFCYDIGPSWPLTSLAPVNAVLTQDCFAGTATATLTGGSAQCNGSNFNIVPFTLVPNNASFNNTSAPDGGTITISGLIDGDAYSYDVTDESGCVITVSGIFTGLEDASFSYDFKYCQNGVDPLPVITGVSGGDFSATPAGMVINTNTGLIDLSATAPGIYTIQYISPAATCYGTETFVLTINPVPVVIATEDSPICDDGISIINLNETGGDATEWLWTTSGGSTITLDTMQNPVVSGASNGETFTVVGLNPNTGCSDNDQISVTVNPMEDPAFTTTDFCIGAANSATVTGTTGGTFAFNPLPGDGATVNSSTGEISNEVAGTTYTLEYTTPGICFMSSTQTVTVNNLPIVNTSDVTVCLGGSVDITATGATTYSWSPGTYLNTTVGATVTTTPLANIVYTVTGTDANGCPNTAISTVTVSGNAPINAGPDAPICAGANSTLTASGGVTYTWDNGLGSGNNFVVSPAVTTTYTVDGIDANGCSGTDQITITVNPLPLVSAGPDQSVCDGVSVTLSGSGASTYVWDNGVTNGVAFTPSPGTVTYTVTGTDASGCVNTDQVDVVVNPLPIVNAGPNQTVCEGVAVTLTASGANTYVWDNGVTNGVAFVPAVGTITYTVTGTDINGCIDTDQVDVTVNPLPVVNAGPDQTECQGTSVTLLGSGANTYIWNNGVTNGVAFTPAVGTVTYTVTGTDVNGCVDTDQVDVTINPLPVVDAGPNQIVCEGTAVTLAGSGASTYVWDNGVTNGVAFTPAVGTISYTVTGTDINGCVNTDQVDVTVNPLPIVAAGSDQTVCVGTSVTLSGSGANTYVWDNGVTNGVAFVPAVGTLTYTVTGTDINGCINTDQVDVTVNPLPVVNAGPDQTECVGAAVTLTGSGASTYVWDNGVTNGVAFTPAVGTVTYTVTGTDINGCVNTDQVDVIINPLPVVNAGPNQIVCEGTAVTLTGSGASTYVWDNGVTNGVAFTPAVGTISYTVTGTDINGCVNTDQVDVTVNPLPVVAAGPDQTVCEGTTVTLSGTGANTYVWDNGVADGVSFTPAPGTVTYTVTGTDANGCVNTDQVDVVVNPLPIVSAGPDQTVCDGTAITLSGSGANTYVWNNGVTNGVAFTPALGTVTYTVTGTDVNGCVGTDQVDVIVNPNPAPTINGANEYCAGFSTTLSTALPYTTYSWTTGDNTPTTNVTIADNPISVTVTNSFGCSGTSPTFTVIENSVINYNSSITICQGDVAVIHGNNETVAGVYSATFILPSGCDSVSNVTLNVNPLPVVDAGSDQVVCENVWTTLTGSGATSYSWDNGITNAVAFSQTVGTVTYTVTGTDANGCVNTDQVDIIVNPLPVVNAGPDQTVCDGVAVTLAGSGANSYVWNNGITNNNAFTPIVGTVTYTVTGTDINGCINTDQVDVTVNPLPVVNAGPDQTVCDGVATTLSGSGASTYVWDNGITNNIAFTQAVGTLTYTVTGTDANGCVNTDLVDVTVNPLPTVNAGPDQSFCDGASTTLTGSGASSYSWDNGITNAVAFSQAVGTLTYTVTGTDANGCVNTDQVDVTVNPLPVVNAGPDQTVCDGVAVTLSGSGAISYVWNNGISDNVSFTPSVGTVTYTVTGTDINSCTNTDQVDVTVNPLPIVNAGPDQTVCDGVATTLFGSGASTYIWDNGITNNVAFTQAVGTVTYTVTGTDANGCVNTDLVDVNVNPLPIVNAGSDQTVCDGESVTLSGSGANTFVWDNGVTEGIAFTPSVGTVTYTVTGTDANGCVNTDQVDVTVNPLPVVNAGPDQTVCDGVAVTLAGSGASSYVWNNGVTDNVAFNQAVGTVTYLVTGTDINGCVNTDQVDVTVNPLPAVIAGPDQTVCDGVATTLSGSGANTYVWDNGISNNVAFVQSVGTILYTVTGTNANGCVNTDQVNVNVNPLPAVNAGLDQTVCDGESVTLNGSGASTYLWDNGVTNGSAFTPPVGTTTYTVTGTDANGCVNIDQVDVIVNPLPVVIAGPDQSVCDGVAVTLSASGAATYVWNNGVVDGTAFNQAVGTTTYLVTGTDGNGCVNTDQVNITVNPLPNVFAGNDIEICQGEQIILTASGASTYVWNNGVTNGNSFSPVNGVYTVVGTDGNGCINTDDVLVTINPLPSPAFIVDAPVCEPFTVTFTNTTPGISSSCIWTINNGAVLTGCGPITYTFPNSGIFDVTLTTTSEDGCEASVTYDDIVNLNDSPNASFNPGSSVITNLNTEIQFENTSTGASSFSWTFGDETQASTAIDPSHVFPSEEAGSYLITLIAYSPLGCIDTAFATITINEEVIFYVPNTFTPDDDDYNETFKPIFTSGFDPFDYTLLIFNRWGEIVFESHNAEIGWDATYASKFDVQDGTYTWKIEFKTKASDKRVQVVGHVNVIR